MLLNENLKLKIHKCLSTLDSQISAPTEKREDTSKKKKIMILYLYLYA